MGLVIIGHRSSESTFGAKNTILQFPYTYSIVWYIKLICQFRRGIVFLNGTQKVQVEILKRQFAAIFHHSVVLLLIHFIPCSGFLISVSSRHESWPLASIASKSHLRPNSDTTLLFAIALFHHRGHQHHHHNCGSHLLHHSNIIIIVVHNRRRQIWNQLKDLTHVVLWFKVSSLSSSVEIWPTSLCYQRLK